MFVLLTDVVQKTSEGRVGKICERTVALFLITKN